MKLPNRKKCLAIGYCAVSDSAGDIFGADNLESNGLDKITSSEGSKTVGKGHCCLGWWMNILLSRWGMIMPFETAIR